MTVIAMTHEIGTFGQEIASQLASHIGIDYADQQFLEERIADRSARDKGRCANQSDSAGHFDRHLQVDGRRLARHASDEIDELAAYGRILIRGWGAASLLRGNPHIIRIRVWAPMSFRLRVMAARDPTREKEALRRLIESSDACLASNLEPVMGPDWRSSAWYHIVLGTHLVSVDEGVAQLVRFITAATAQDRGPSHRQSARELTYQPACQRSRLASPIKPTCIYEATGAIPQCHRCRTL